MKNKFKVIIFVLLILLFFACCFGIYQHFLKKDIKSKYHSSIVTKDQSFLYIKENHQYVKVGSIQKEISLNLEKEKELSKYFKIKDTKYYIYYQDIAKKAESLIGYQKEHYLPIQKDVIIKKNASLYQDGKVVLRLYQSIEVSLYYMDDEFYYFSYFDQLLAVKREDASLKDISRKQEESTSISILYYKNKPTEEVLQKEWKLLEDGGFYTISFEDYKKWLQGFICLEKNAILIVSEDESFQKEGAIINVVKEDGIHFLLDNKASSKENSFSSLSSYLISEETTEEYFKKILNQESFSYPKKVVSNSSTSSKRNLSGNASTIPVLNYHFFYDPTGGEVCNEGNCLSTQKFEEQLQYLKDQGYQTLTMEEFRKWMYQEIELPAKSVLLTVDDGAMGTGKQNGNKLIPILEKYQMNATLFLITGWWGIDNYQSKYLDVESHSHNLHTEGICSTQARGAKMLCSSYEEVLQDLKQSIQITGSNKAFCYPFFVSNPLAIQEVQDVGFQLAFVGGGNYASRNSNKYQIPRFQITSSTTIQQFINIVS